MKKIVSLLLTLIICVSLVSCNEKENSSSEEILSSVATSESVSTESEDLSSAESSENSSEISEALSEESSEEEQASTPALFKVSDENGNYAWLFGSIHIGDDKFYPLPEYVESAFEEADALAVEFDIIAFQNNYMEMINAMSLMVYQDGSIISENIDPEIYQDAVKILAENGVYSAEYEYYIPSFWADLISEIIYDKLKVDLNNGVDKTLLRKAKKALKPIYDVESAEIQFGMMANYSDKLQEYLLKSAIEDYNEFVIDETEFINELDKLCDTWASGNIDAIREILNEEPEEFESDEEKLLYEEYNKAMMTDRDKHMVEYTKDVIASGETVFICVGAAHVLGETGMIYQLEQAGYTVEQVK